MYLIVGFGKLAQSIIKLSSYPNEILIYTRTKEKVEEYDDKRILYVTKEDFHKAKHILLMLPASEIAPFLEQNESFFNIDAKVYSFATALHCKELKTKRTVIPCKLAGHAKQMVEDQHGLFVLPVGENSKPLVDFFGGKFSIINGTEEEVLMGNSLGTKAAIEMIIDLEEKLREAGIQKAIIAQTLSQVTRGNIKSYINNDLGGFAQKIVKDIRKGRKVN
jgi:hypothetical protein